MSRYPDSNSGGSSGWRVWGIPDSAAGGAASVSASPPPPLQATWGAFATIEADVGSWCDFGSDASVAVC